MANKRKSISKKLRFEVFKRDGFSCQYCGSKPPEVPLEVDHITPVSKGGLNDIDNLLTACFDCNRGKSNNELSSVPKKLSDKIERVKVAQSQYAEYKKLLREKELLVEADIYSVEIVYNTAFEGYIFTDNFRITVKKFIQKMGIESVVDAMEIACIRICYDEQEVLKYFCGICWTRIREGSL